MQFSQTHEWVKVEGDHAVVGISEFAQKELGEIVYVELPPIGEVVNAGDEIVVLESTKAAVDIYSPLSGEVIAINENLASAPEKINTSPESEGWLFKLRLHKKEELSSLMNASTYHNFIQN